MSAPLPLALDLWAKADPSLLGTLAVALVATLALGATWWLLAQAESEQGEGLEPERRAIARARARLDAALRGGDRTLQAALEPLLRGPLADLDQRVAALCAAAARVPPALDPARRAQRQELAAALEREPDPRARALLAATLEDLDRAERAGESIGTKARLARLELARLRVLLESLPARIEELALRPLQRDPEGAAEIALQLEQAVACTEQVLSDLLLTPGGPS